MSYDIYIGNAELEVDDVDVEGRVIILKLPEAP